MARAAYPRNKTSCSGTNSAHSWDRQHFILTSPSWSTSPKPSPASRSGRQFIASRQSATFSMPSMPLSASQHASIPASRPVPRSTLSVRSRKLDNVGRRRTVVMCQFAVTGLIRAGLVRPPVTSHNPSGALSYARVGPRARLCNGALRQLCCSAMLGLQPWYQPTLEHTWESVGAHLTCPWRTALLAAGWPCCRPRTPYPAALPESSAVALFLRRFLLSHGRILCPAAHRSARVGAVPPVPRARQELTRLRAPLPPWRYMASLELGAGLAFRLNGTAEELQ